MSPLKPDLRDRMKAAFCFLTNSKTTAVRICTEVEDPIAIEDAGDLNAHFFENTEASDKTQAVIIINETIGAGQTYKMNAVVCTTSVEGVCFIYKDALKIGAIRIGAGKKNGIFPWKPSRDIVAGEVLKVEFEAASTNGKDVDIFVQGRLI